jgi:hypothetical protein
VSEDKNTPGPWVVRARYAREISGTFVNHPPIMVDCFVQAPDVHGYAYAAEVLGDDEYREDDGVARKLADCQLIAAALVMREALREIAKSEDAGYMRGVAEGALAELTKAPI